MTSESIKNLVERCNKLIELNLCYTEIENEGVTAIIENLSQSLVKIELPGTVEIAKVLELCRSMPKLKHLYYDYQTIINDIEWERQFPHLVINKEHNMIAHLIHPLPMLIVAQEAK